MFSLVIESGRGRSHHGTEIADSFITASPSASAATTPSGKFKSLVSSEITRRVGPVGDVAGRFVKLAKSNRFARARVGYESAPWEKVGEVNPLVPAGRSRLREDEDSALRNARNFFSGRVAAEEKERGGAKRHGCCGLPGERHERDDRCDHDSCEFSYDLRGCSRPFGEAACFCGAHENARLIVLDLLNHDSP